MPLADDVDLDAIAAVDARAWSAPTCKNLVNEAALTAARRDHEQRRSWPTSPTRSRRSSSAPSGGSCSRRRSASAPPTTSPATRCSGCSSRAPTRCARSRSCPRGRALGVTFQAPDADRYGYDADYLRGRIVGALGGRAAEELVYGDVTTGAESDLEQVTRDRPADGRPLGHVGGDRPGLRAARARSDEPLLFPGTGGGPSRRARASSSTRRSAASSTSATPRRSSCCARTATSSTRWPQALLERETLDEADAYRVAGISREAAPAR